MTSLKIANPGDKQDMSDWRNHLDRPCVWVRLKEPVKSDLPFFEPLVAEPGLYAAQVNPQGAVSVRVNGHMLGVKPGEFEWCADSIAKTVGKLHMICHFLANGSISEFEDCINEAREVLGQNQWASEDLERQLPDGYPENSPVFLEQVKRLLNEGREWIEKCESYLAGKSTKP